MTAYCPDCGSEVIDVAYVTSGSERARRCNRCDLETPYPQTWVYVEEREGVYHANADCEHVDPTDSSTIQPRFSANAVPCFGCFGVGGNA